MPIDRSRFLTLVAAIGAGSGMVASAEANSPHPNDNAANNELVAQNACVSA